MNSRYTKTLQEGRNDSPLSSCSKRVKAMYRYLLRPMECRIRKISFVSLIYQHLVITALNWIEDACIYPSPRWGSFCPPPPLWFFDDKSKRERSRATKLGIAFHWSILHLLRKKLYGWPQVRSPGQITWPNLQKDLSSCHSRSSQGNAFNFSEPNKAISTYNLYISDFFFISVTWGQAKLVTSPLQVNGEILKSFPFKGFASVRHNSFRIMSF